MRMLPWKRLSPPLLFWNPPATTCTVYGSCTAIGCLRYFLTSMKVPEPATNRHCTRMRSPRSSVHVIISHYEILIGLQWDSNDRMQRLTSQPRSHADPPSACLGARTVLTKSSTVSTSSTKTDKHEQEGTQAFSPDPRTRRYLCMVHKQRVRCIKKYGDNPVPRERSVHACTRRWQAHLREFSSVINLPLPLPFGTGAKDSMQWCSISRRFGASIPKSMQESRARKRRATKSTVSTKTSTRCGMPPICPYRPAVNSAEDRSCWRQPTQGYFPADKT